MDRLEATPVVTETVAQFQNRHFHCHKEAVPQHSPIQPGKHLNSSDDVN